MNPLVLAIPLVLLVFLATYLRGVHWRVLLLTSHRGLSDMWGKLGLFLILYIGGTFLSKLVIMFLPDFGETMSTILGLIVTALLFWVILRKYGQDALD